MLISFVHGGSDNLFMVGHITGKMFDHLIEKDCVSDLSDPGTSQTGPIREVAGPENAAI